MKKKNKLLLIKRIYIWFCFIVLIWTVVPPTGAGTGKVKAFFFYAQTCPDCRVIKDEFLPGFKQKYQDRVEIKSFEIASIDLLPDSHGLYDNLSYLLFGIVGFEHYISLISSFHFGGEFNMQFRCAFRRDSLIFVEALANLLGISEAAVSQHLKILRKAGLVKGEKRGYWTHYLPEKERLLEIAANLNVMVSKPLTVQELERNISVDKCESE